MSWISLPPIPCSADTFLDAISALWSTLNIVMQPRSASAMILTAISGAGIIAAIRITGHNMRAGSEA